MQENNEITTRLNNISADLAARTTVTLAMVPVTVLGVCNTLYTLLLLSPAIKARNQDIENRIANLEQFTGVIRPAPVENYATRTLNKLGTCCKKNKKTKQERQAKLTEYFKARENLGLENDVNDIESNQPKIMTRVTSQSHQSLQPRQRNIQNQAILNAL
jgi:hypothetical protein